MPRFRGEERHALPPRQLTKRGAQRAVVGHAARKSETAVAALPLIERGPRLAHQRVDHRRLVARAQVAPAGRHLVRRHPLDQVTQARLQPGEAEVQLVAPADPARKRMGRGVPSRRQPLDVRSAGVTQAQQLRPLVQGLTGRVITRRGKHAERTVRRHVEQKRVAAGDDQGEVRQRCRERLREGRRSPRMHRDEGRPDVAPQVVHPRHRNPERQGERLRRGHPDGQARRQPGSVRDRHLRHVREARPSMQFRKQGTEVPQVFAGREVRHHAAMTSVQRHLAVHEFRHQSPAGVEKRGRRLVARAFQREDHGEPPPEARPPNQRSPSSIASAVSSCRSAAGS